MDDQQKIKWIPRNATAAKRQGLITGNPVITRLESGVGNCFPGLEMDLRNLERRFFPFLEVDFIFNDTTDIRVVSVDPAALTARLPAGNPQAYRAIAADMDNPEVTWRIERITGDFGPLGRQTVRVSDLNGTSSATQRGQRRPPDAWTAVRLLKADSEVRIWVARRKAGVGRADRTVSLKGRRARYLDENGAFAAMFNPEELTQSLCSPWTHDFRDCACFYWASNHPDIVLPPSDSGRPTPPLQEAIASAWNVAVPWLRADRGTPAVPSQPAHPTGDRAREMDYYEINERWQQLDVVIEGRELRRGSYRRTGETVPPLSSRDVLERHLRYAAGVELGVMHEYITAAYSLNRGVRSGTLHDDIAAAHAEIMRVAISEMRHLRAVNDVLTVLHRETNPGAPFKPALQVASLLPALKGPGRPVAARPLTPDVLQEFIDIERPSASVDGLYAPILATLEHEGLGYAQQIVQSIMEEGFDHFVTFGHVSEWLGRHPESQYLLALKSPPDTQPEHKKLQQRYRRLLDTLRAWFTVGLPAGREQSLSARAQMVGASGLEGECEKLTAARFLIVFDKITTDPDFGEVAPPQDR